MAESKQTECVICLEEFKNNKICACGFCEYKGCIGCTKQSILYQSTDPVCPNCNHAWSMEFCYETFTKSWMTKTYRDHKKQLLFDIEKSKIPNTMPAVERIVKINTYTKKKCDLKDELLKLESLIWETKCKMASYERKIEDLKYNKAEKNDKPQYNFKCPKNDCSGFLNEKFICPMCSSHVCKKCFEIKEIEEQEEISGETKCKDKVKYNHTCKQENIDSFNLIKKETKPCPKCSARIFKISGCDQMWCTQCHVTFSWTTGREVTGNIHNPHYYEWKKNNAETANLRNVGETLCGGIPDLNILSALNRNCEYLQRKVINQDPYYAIQIFNCENKQEEFYKNVCTIPINNTVYGQSYVPIFESINLPNTIREIFKTSQVAPLTDRHEYNEVSDKLKRYYISIHKQKLFLDNILKLHRSLSHFENFELHNLRIAVRDIDQKDEDLRIKFIMKQIDEKHYKTLIMKKNNKKQKLIKILHIFEMCNVTLIETFNDIVKTFIEIANEYDNHRTIMFNSQDRFVQNYYNDIYLPWFKHNIDIKKPNIIEKYNRINNIINYCNRELWKVSKLFNQNVPFIHYGCYTEETINTSTGVQETCFERPGHLQTISAKWDCDLFQLWDIVNVGNKSRKTKVKGDLQNKYLNNCWLFNNNDNFTYYDHHDRHRSTNWGDAYESYYVYRIIIGIKEIFDLESKEEKNKKKYVRKKGRDITYKYSRGLALF